MTSNKIFEDNPWRIIGWIILGFATFIGAMFVLFVITSIFAAIFA